ncbi:MAG: ferritin-like domain-containing protein [Myxococcaceae bacterium]
MIWSDYLRHFEQNARRPLPEVRPESLEPVKARALARSLARFQLGEAGEGRIAHQIDTAQLPAIDDDYRAALKLFVREEGRHGRVLALIVNALGGRLLEKQWTERLFVRARRMVGIRFKLLVLLAAEVIGIAFYGALARKVPGTWAKALEQLCADEEVHLEFHCHFFAQQPGFGGWLLRAAWRPLGWAAALTVLADHRSTLKALDVRGVLRSMGERIEEAAVRMTGSRSTEGLVRSLGNE